MTKTKRCNVCKKIKPIRQFRRLNKKKKYRSYCCRSCQKTVTMRSWRKNRARYTANSYAAMKRRRQEGMLFVYKYLQEHPCVDCGEDNPIVLEFDHVKGKKRKSVSLLVCDGLSIAGIVEEIEKCEVRCANCHRIKTAGRPGTSYYQKWQKLKMLERTKSV
jgi:protein-arginine kinase activator protein McsA